MREFKMEIFSAILRSLGTISQYLAKILWSKKVVCLVPFYDNLFFIPAACYVEILLRS